MSTTVGSCAPRARSLVDTANCPDILALVAHMILCLLVVPTTKAPSLQAVSKPPHTSEHARFVVGLLGGACLLSRTLPQHSTAYGIDPNALPER